MIFERTITYFLCCSYSMYFRMVVPCGFAANRVLWSSEQVRTKPKDVDLTPKLLTARVQSTHAYIYIYVYVYIYIHM